MPRVVAVLLLAVSLAGCSTLPRYELIDDRYGLITRLRSQKPLFGKEIERGFDHPRIIAPERLANILGGIDVDFPEEKGSILERRPALAQEIIEPVATSLAKALAQASPNQEVVVQVLRKQMQHGIFNRKFLTTFVAFVRDERLALYFSHIDLKLDEKLAKNELPEPRPGRHPMRFRMVETDLYRIAGRQGVEVRWRDPIFRRPVAATAPAQSDVRRKTILATEPLRAPAPGEDAHEGLRKLDAEQLRRLAELEEQREQGTITESDYRRGRDEVLGQ